MTQAALDRLCRQLASELQRGARAPGEVARLLASYARAEDDWRRFVFFETGGYTRNLVHRCADYELLLLCWGEDQASPIHDHAGQSCWMAVLEGEIEEVQFRRGGTGLAARAPQPLAKGSVGFIEDDIGLHLIRPREGWRGISLHLYAQPIDRCEVYDPRTGQSTEIELGYHSVRGERCDRPASAVRAEWGGTL